MFRDNITMAKERTAMGEQRRLKVCIKLQFNASDIREVILEKPMYGYDWVTNN